MSWRISATLGGHEFGHPDSYIETSLRRQCEESARTLSSREPSSLAAIELATAMLVDQALALVHAIVKRAPGSGCVVFMGRDLQFWAEGHLGLVQNMGFIGVEHPPPPPTLPPLQWPTDEDGHVT